MFWKYAKGAETPRFRRGSKPPKPAGKIQLGLDVKRCAECGKYERPCLADGKPATFHRWIEEEKVLLKINVFMRPDEQLKCIRRFHEEGVFDNCCSTEKARACAALVEYPDGSVGRVKPELIQFLDRKEG